MKKTILSILTLAGLFALADLRADEGSIYEVAACTEIGGDVLESAYPLWPIGSTECTTAGHDMYFRVRLCSPNDSGNNWALVHYGSSPEALDMALFPPRICIFVSGVERWATLVTVNELEKNGFKFADLVFKYTTKPGDFALPIVLGAKVGTGVKPALDPTATTTEYSIDLRGKWGFEYKLSATSVVTPNWWLSATGKAGVSRIRDIALTNARYNIQTVDFDSGWETNNVVWRSVHQGTDVTIGALPKIVRKAAAEEAVTLYVWSTNENAVVVSGPDVEEVESDPVNHPGVKFHVAKVTIGASPSENATGSFTIRGVNKLSENGWSGLVLSPYKQFNKRNSLGEYYDDYITVPVRCVEELPPSVIVTVEDSIVYATHNYLKAATRVRVALTQATAGKFKVRLNPAFSEDGVALDPDVWGKYVRFSATQSLVESLPTATAASTEVELGGDVTEVFLWMYALLGDSHTGGGVNMIEFQSVPEGTYPPEVVAFNKGACQLVSQDPAIVEPVTGSTVEATAGDEKPMLIKVEGSYGDDLSDEGYEIYVKYKPEDTAHATGAPAGFVKIEGRFKPGEGSILERCDDGSKAQPVFKWKTAGEYKTLIYVVAPVSKKKSCGTTAAYLELNANITPMKSVKITTPGDKTEFNEGEESYINIELSEAYDENLYAFLKIETDDVSPEQFSSGTPYIIGMTNQYGKCKGAPVGKNKTKQLPRIKFLDGYGPASGGYLSVDFSVVLATVQDYDQATNQNKIVTSYESETLMLTVNNVEPTVKRMQLGGFDSDYNGYEYTFKLPMNQNQDLKAVVNEASSYDLNHDFKSLWIISTSTTRNGAYTQREKIEVTGNPTNTAAFYSFPYRGWTRIQVRVKDKDMDDYPDISEAYETYVEVLDKPGITVEPLEEMPSETDTKQKITFGLTYFDSQDELVMKITVDPKNKTGDIKQDGELLLDGEYRKPPAGYGLTEATNVYYLTFTSGDPQDIMIARMDGTPSTETAGIYIKAEIITEDVNPKTGDRWCDYYTKNLTTRVYPANVAPNKADDSISFSPDSNPTSRWEVAGGAASAHPLTWRLRSDVDLDLEAGVTVRILGGGGSSTIYHAPAMGTFIPDFGSSQGNQEVRIEIEDKDGGIVSRTWYFTVTPSKFLTTVAHGPSSGSSMVEQSKKYKTASGLGEGHVFATSPASFDSASDFRLKWNCSSADSVPVYAWGYKMAFPKDDGKLDTHDQAIDETGASTGGTITNPYIYKDLAFRDSFFYAWILEAQTGSTSTSGSSSGTQTGEKTYKVSISPEQPLFKATVGTVALATSTASDGSSWPATEAEAIFAKEYLWSDNMGDINFDRIPDLYFVKYDFTQKTETGTDPAGNTQTETTEVDDITSLASYNKDLDKNGDEKGDFLPSDLTSAVSKDVLPREFTAELEIRGIGPALNNAPELAGIAGVKPEIRYTDPDNDANVAYTNRSTLTKLEYEAWCDYAAAKGIVDPQNPAAWYDATGKVIWSPERPSRPDLVDSDEDGFDDGLEYWYWYRAHVGYYDADGVHRYQTGRRFDPRNPGQGIVITSEEIEAQMDPITPSGFDAKYRDSDNDGIPDLLETVLGTDPFDFDTDGDGLPDGWEVVISGTNPCGTVSDADANADGDAMAISSAKLEEAVLPTPLYIKPLTVFAVLDEEGQSDGVQWYATASEDPLALATETVACTVITLDNDLQFATTNTVLVSSNQTLAASLSRKDTFLLSADMEALMPYYLAKGTKIKHIETAVDVTVYTLDEDIDEKDLNTCWVYGRDNERNAALGELNDATAAAGFLALGKYQGLKQADKEIICWLPTNGVDVAYLHYLVYQEYGFDPRTAWKSAHPLASRWTNTDKGSGAYEGVGMKAQGGYTSYPTRTRAYTAYDEFLVMSFFLNNGTLDEADDVEPTTSNPWSAIWAKYTTNPRGPGEESEETDTTTADTDTDTEDEDSPKLEYAKLDDNGADTDKDGVPDGWELYIMAGPKVEGQYNFADPDAVMSPFVASAQLTSTDNPTLVGTENSDGLVEFREFGGTDTIAYYESINSNLTSTATIKRADTDLNWINKFFPTDPWNGDTDGDGVKDSAEGTAFIYGTPADDGKLWSVPGGGLNPCAIDTDLDGIPDGWENQFKGSTVYAGDDAVYATVGGTNVGNPLEGLIDGMDGTVPDSMNMAKTGKGETITTWTKTEFDGRRWSGKINRDYDHDGLENWQEYLSGTMRCWRYDDPLTRWEPIPRTAYYTYNSSTKTWTWNPQYAELGVADEKEFWAKTLFDVKSPIYNPHLVTDVVAGQYFSRVTNGWDTAYCDGSLNPEIPGGTYYWLKDRIGDQTLKSLWGEAIGKVQFTNPSKYASCSPIDPDTDGDGMDDYYELFHGMNPLLGKAGVLSGSEQPFDVIADVYAIKEVVVISAWGPDANYWMSGAGRASRNPRGNEYDFVAYPWLNGEATADPDGDDLRNQQEAIMPMQASATWQHTDPTPLWMTDSSYAKSLVNLYYRLPTHFDSIPTEVESVDVGGVERYLREADGYCPEEGEGLTRVPPSFGAFVPDYWLVAGNGQNNWMYSFEENEGYDTDHDGINDNDEVSGKYAQDKGGYALDFDQSRHHQAMWFPGANSVLQTMPVANEFYPMAKHNFTEDPSFKQFTVECWVKADASMLDGGTYVVVERPVWTDVSKPADEEYIRRNFQLSICEGKWSAMFESSGTLANRPISLKSTAAATTEWTHLAATYDNQVFKLYVNGVVAASVATTQEPEYGAFARVGKDGEWAGVMPREISYHAILVGASLKSQQEFDPTYMTSLDISKAVGRALDLTAGLGWNYYARFFKGYIDEVRIWDGARTKDEIKELLNVRIDRDFALANRKEIYAQWSKVAPAYSQYPQGCRRYVKDSSGNDCSLPAELRYHFSFDSVPAAENTAMAAKAPHGFENNAATWSRPDDWTIGWWQKALAGYTGTVYSNPKWVTWAPNTMAHLPRFDGTTLDSIFWSTDFRGDENSTYTFQNRAEPVSLWTQWRANGATKEGYIKSTSSRLWLSMELTNTNFRTLFDFTGRHFRQSGDDLVVLGGAYARYTDIDTGMWDKQGPSSYSEITGADADDDGLPNWWEDYADQNYRRADMSPSDTIGWDTIVNYRGNLMPAYQAYFRDMARGYYADKNGNIVTDDTTSYRQTRDSKNAGVPDWWMNNYGILGESALDDHDGDGLSNYTEYLLSEVFDFKRLFSPVEPRSVDPYTLDYFYRIGEVYAGEIFTDHDLVEDIWEDQYDSEYASRTKYDAFADADEDGWCNRSEARFSNLCSPIVASIVSHYTATDGLVADHPIPTLQLKVRYDGLNAKAVNKAAMVIQVNSDTTLQRSPDAVYTIAAPVQTDKTDGDTLYQVLGKWSDRMAVGTLTPGNVSVSSLGFEFCADPSSVTYTWYITSENNRMYHGTRQQYDDACLKHPGFVVLVDKDVVYSTLSLDRTTSETDDIATWTLDNGKVLGSIDLTTGEYVINLGSLKDVTVTKSTEDSGSQTIRMEDQSFRIRYEVNPAVDLPRMLYLGSTDDGYVREGKNTVIAWAETIAEDGVWQPGEPFGVVTDVDISWRRRELELNLTDTHPVFARVNLQDCTTDRDYWYGEESGVTTNGVAKSLTGGQIERVRVIRYAVDGFDCSKDSSGNFSDVLNKVVLDRNFDLSVKNVLHEGDFISKISPDIDWDDLDHDFGDSFDITNVAYRIVLGNELITGFAAPKRALSVDIHRHYDLVREMPVAISPSQSANAQITDPNPTFEWKINGLDMTYTAFRIVVMNEKGTEEVWNSGLQIMPPLNSDGTYRWKAPLFVDDIDTQGRIFRNKGKYSWKVAMYNAKFRSDEFSEGLPSFSINVQSNSVFYGNAAVAVKYYGPKESYAGKVIRVRAYTSPDFTGTPVASGYVQYPDDADTGVSVTGKAVRANCQLIGIPRGSYYLQAFIDSNNNNECDPWETMGYAWDVEESGMRRYNPTALTFGDERGTSDLVTIYLEDADTDNDGLPDAWEYAKFNGDLNAKGVELVSETPAGEIMVNPDLTKTLSLQENSITPSSSLAGRTGRMVNNAGLLALAMGVPISSNGATPFASAISSSISDELVEEGVRITSLGFDLDGNVRLEVEAAVETEAANSALAGTVVQSTSDGTLKVSCQLYRKEQLSDATWQPVGDAQVITVGAEAAAVTIKNATTDGSSGFYKVILEKQ